MLAWASAGLLIIVGVVVAVAVHLAEDDSNVDENQDQDRFVRFTSPSVSVYHVPDCNIDHFNERVVRDFTPRATEEDISIWRVCSTEQRDLVVATWVGHPSKKKCQDDVKWLEIDWRVLELAGISAELTTDGTSYKCHEHLHYSIVPTDVQRQKLGRILAEAFRRGARDDDTEGSRTTGVRAVAERRKRKRLLPFVTDEAQRCTPEDLAKAPPWVAESAARKALR